MQANARNVYIFMRVYSDFNEVKLSFGPPQRNRTGEAILRTNPPKLTNLGRRYRILYRRPRLFPNSWIQSWWIGKTHLHALGTGPEVDLARFESVNPLFLYLET